MTDHKAIDIVKRNGRRPTEGFELEKLHKSIVAALLSAQTAPGQAESVARAVTRDVIEWLEARPEVTSEDLKSFCKAPEKSSPRRCILI